MVNFDKVQEIRNNAKTCKDCETFYKNLIESGLDKETAKETIKAAKNLIKAEKAENKAEKDFVVGWFSDYEKVGKSLLLGICKEDGIKFREIAEKYETIAEFIAEFVTRADSFGRPIRKTKDGYKYRKMSAQNVRALLRECIVNFVAEKNGNQPKYARIETAEIIAE